MSKKKSNLSNIIFGHFDEPPWPSFVKPLAGELFTSWLLRLSRSHLVRYYTFCSSYFNGIEFWDRDLDKFLPNGIREIILKKCILKSEDIDQMRLVSFQPNLFVTDIASRSPWFTPFSVYSLKHGAKHRTTLPVCPSCLKKDGTEPYFRKSWRLSIKTVCVECGTELIDVCPECGMPINHLIAEKGRRSQTPIFPVTYCWKCLCDLSQVVPVPAEAKALEMQQFFATIIETGHDARHGLQYAHLYFLVLRKILSLLNKHGNPQLDTLQRELSKAANVEFIVPKNSRANSFETLSVANRANLLYKAYWLLEEWPGRFRELSARAGLRSKIFVNDFPDIPYWFKTELDHNRIVYSKWRKDFSETYSSFAELAKWRVSKISRRKENGGNEQDQITR